MDHYHDRQDFDLFFHKQLARLQPSRMNKDGCILASRNTFEDNAHSTKNCDRILSGKVGIGKSTVRRHPPHLQQIGGTQENGTNHNKENGKISNGGKSFDFSIHQFFCKSLAHS